MSFKQKNVSSITDIEHNNKDFSQNNLLFVLNYLNNLLQSNNSFPYDYQAQSVSFEQEIDQQTKILNQQIFLKLKDLNVDHRNNLSYIKNKFQSILYTNFIQKDKKEHKYIKELIKKIKHNNFAKKKINALFEQNIDSLKQKTQTDLDNIIFLEQKTHTEQEKEKNNFLQKHLEISEKTKFKSSETYQSFHEKNILINKQIIVLKNGLNANLNKLERNYKKNLTHINQKAIKKNNIFAEKMQKINDLFQNKLADHNKIFDQEKNTFKHNKNALEKKKQILFEEKKLMMFFFLESVSKTKEKCFLSLMKEMMQNEIRYYKDLNIWRKKYFWLKFLYNKALNIIALEKKIFVKITDMEIYNQHLICKQEKELINHEYLQQIKMLDIELRQTDVQKHYEMIKIERREEYAKNKLEYLFLQKNQEIQKKINNLEFQRKVLFLKHKTQHNKYLLKMQLKIEKIKITSEYYAKIIQNHKQIQRLKEDLEHLYVNQEHKIHFENMNYKQQQENLLFRMKVQQIKIENIIEKNFINQKNILKKLISFIAHLNEANNRQNNLINIMQDKLNNYLNNNKSKVLFDTEEFEEVSSLLQFFIDQIHDKHFDSHYLLQKEIYLFEELLIQEKIDLIQVILEYYDKNISFIRDLVHNVQFKYDNPNNNFFAFFDKKIKISNNLYQSWKEQLNHWQKQKKNNKDQKESQINALRKTQNKILQKKNFYQNKLFQQIITINQTSAPKTFLSQISNKFKVKKFWNYWWSFWHNLTFFVDQSRLDYYEWNKYNRHILSKQEQDKQNLLLTHNNKIFLLTDIFLDIAKDIHFSQIKNIRFVAQEEENRIKKTIEKEQQAINQQLVQMKEKITLIQENLDDTLKEIENNFVQEMKQIEEEKKLLFQDFLSAFKKKSDLIVKKIKLYPIQNKITKQNQEKKEKIIFDSYENSQNTFLQKNNSILKQINKIDKKTVRFRKKQLFRGKIKLLLLKILWRLKYQKDKLELYKNHKKNKNNSKKYFNQQIYLYRELNLLLGI
ncbi:hypothetical protein [Italian clover phyllody phytoplasma]|uniref:hypothetical protein n=1 Tax=Italian clover phyllody phytoplasma TaxID=1196420 RepID=UPI00036211B2|nr:hypothetical protein [Italian clover phyllody phytoplasma]